MGLGKGILAMGALAAAAAAFMFGGSKEAKAATPQTPTAAFAPPNIAARMVAALATADPAKVRQEAARLRKEGFEAQAQDLESAANTMSTVQTAVTTSPPQNQPVQVSPPLPKPAVQPPPAAIPASLDKSKVAVTSPGQPTQFHTTPAHLPPKLPIENITEQVIRATAPPIAGTPVAPSPPTPQKLLAARAANMLRGAVKGREDKQLVTAYQAQEQPEAGKIDGLYGPKTGRTFLKHNIVPPKPLYFSSKTGAADRAAWKALMFQKAATDPQRAEEYMQSANV